MFLYKNLEKILEEFVCTWKYNVVSISWILRCINLFKAVILGRIISNIYVWEQCLSGTLELVQKCSYNLSKCRRYRRKNHWTLSSTSLSSSVFLKLIPQVFIHHWKTWVCGCQIILNYSLRWDLHQVCPSESNLRLTLYLKHKVRQISREDSSVLSHTGQSHSLLL